MKRIALFLAALAFVWCGIYYLFRVPARKGFEQITLSPSGTETNATGQVTHFYAVSNGCPQTVRVLPGIQANPRRIDMARGPAKELKPGEETVVAISFTLPQRPVVHCQKGGYRDERPDRSWTLFNYLVLKRKEVDLLFPPP